MLKKLLIALGLVSVLMVLFSNKISDFATLPSSQFEEVESVIDVEIKPAGDRLLGLALTEGEVGFDQTFATAREMRASLVTLPIFWDDIEPEKGEYESSWLGIANEVYGGLGTPMSLEINPIDTNNVRLPSYLADKGFSDPEVIGAYLDAMQYVADETKDMNIKYLVIGNEVDGMIPGEGISWSDYQTFLEGVVPVLHTLFPGAKVGVKVMFISVTKPEVVALHDTLDAIFVTHYMLKEGFGSLAVRSPEGIAEDFEEITRVYTDKPIAFLELGYPSSDLLGSSEQHQAAFISHAFAAWDRHNDQIETINFLGVHDYSTKEVKTFTDYYGFNDKSFIGFLSSLGLLKADGTQKKASAVFREEATVRGF